MSDFNNNQTLDDGSIPVRLVSTTVTLDPTNLSLEATQQMAVAGIDALNTAIGTVADAAWSGTGNGTVIAILKAIAANTAP